MLLVNDKVTARFYYNLGVEYFKLLQQVHGHGQLMAMMDGDNYEQQSGEMESQQNQIVSDLQQLNFESNEVEIQSPSKVTNYYSMKLRNIILCDNKQDFHLSSQETTTNSDIVVVV